MPKQDTTCQGTRDDGEPCQSKIINDEGFCVAHRPGGKDELSRRGKKGGTIAQHLKGNRVTREDLGPLDTYEDVQRWCYQVALGVAEGRMKEKAANSIVRVLKVWAEAEAESRTVEIVDELQDEIDRLKGQLDEGPEVAQWR